MGQPEVRPAERQPRLPPAGRSHVRLTSRHHCFGLPWATILGLIRVATHRQIVARPLPVEAACARVRAWLSCAYVSILHPGDRHAEILFGPLARLGTGGNLTTDAHLAALCIEHQAELHSTDADLSRFPGLRWKNPVA